MIYPIFKKNNILTPAKSYLTSDSVEGRNDYYLTDEFVNGKKRYRLHSKKPMTLAECLDFKIKCPNCNNYLTLCDMPLSSTELGQYKCESCEKI